MLRKPMAEIMASLKENDLLDGYATADQTEVEAIIHALKNNWISITEGGYGTDNGGDRTPYFNETATGSKPYSIDAQIDHQPFRIKMKYPIEFDTSY